MIWILAVRDNQTAKVSQLRPLSEDERADMASFYARMHQQYPPPCFDLEIGYADSVDEFVRVYPRFA